MPKTRALFLLTLTACAADGPPTAKIPPSDPKITPVACAAAPLPAGEAVAPEEQSYRRSTPLDEKNACEVADSNLARVEARLLSTANTQPPVERKAWDKRKQPKYLDLVDSRLSLSKSERALLTKNGFVVSPRWRFSNYAGAYHEIYQSQLPVYVSADSILHAIYVSNDRLIADIEKRSLEPMLNNTLTAMHCKLADAGLPQAVAQDLDLYLAVARSLLAGTHVAGVFGSDASDLVKAATNAKGMADVKLFGRERKIDWSQYEPRGHYAGDLARYFRTAMWLSRLEFNLVSRSSRSSHPGELPDPSETPHEAIVALALSDLASRANVTDNINKLDDAWGLLSGRREDVSISDLASLRNKAGIVQFRESEFPKLKSAIGNDFRRTARIHYMPEGSVELPAIATFLGPRIVPDTAAFRPLTHSEVSNRHMMGAADVAFVLGSDRARTYLKDDLQNFPTLGSQLEKSRGILDQKGNDLYSIWLMAVESAAKKPVGSVPAFMDTDAYADMQVNTVVAAYGQMRHNYVLMAGQAYSEGGCEIPDGYVEPAIGTYDALITYATRGKSVLQQLDPKDETHAIAYFRDLERVLGLLRRISKDELDGRPLTADERAFLSMVAEINPEATGSPPTYTGWYFNAFRTRQDDGLKSASFVADYFTSGLEHKVVYAGARSPRLGIFVIDTGGEPRVAVGPIADAYETTSSVEQRLTDETAEGAPGKRSPWSDSFVAAPINPTAFKASFVEHPEINADITFEFKSAPGLVTIEILDHHRKSIERITRRFTTTTARVVPKVSYEKAAGFRVRIGESVTEAFRGVGTETLMSVGDWPQPAAQ